MAIDYTNDVVDVITVEAARPPVFIDLQVAGFQGAAGAQGAAGPPASLTIGTVSTGAGGSLAAADISGTSPDQTLHLTIPSGANNYIDIGTITTGPPGSMASAFMSGESPNQILNLVLPAGSTGQGILVLGASDTVPVDTPAGTVIFRTA